MLRVILSTAALALAATGHAAPLDATSVPARPARDRDTLDDAVSCSPKKACDFVQALHRGGARSWQKFSLVCAPAENCTISGTRLGGGVGLHATVAMANVLVRDSTAASGGGLLNINGGGSVTGTNLTFRNGAATKCALLPAPARPPAPRGA